VWDDNTLIFLVLQFVQPVRLFLWVRRRCPTGSCRVEADELRLCSGVVAGGELGLVGGGAGSGRGEGGVVPWRDMSLDSMYCTCICNNTSGG
jgi:hypothetical protein